LLNKLHEVFVYASAAGSCSCTWHEAKCISRIVRHLLLFCSLLLIENMRFRSSAETGIVLNLFFNFKQK